MITSNGELLNASYSGSKTFSDLVIFRTELETAIIKLRTQGKRVQLLMDLTGLDQHQITPESRAEFMKIAQLDFDNAAVLADKQLAKVVKIIVQNSNRRHKVQFFTDKTQANKWLITGQHPEKHQHLVSLVAASLLFLITAVTLTGWAIGNIPGCAKKSRRSPA